MKRHDRELWQGQTVILAAARAGAGQPCQFCKDLQVVIINGKAAARLPEFFFNRPLLAGDN